MVNDRSTDEIRPSNVRGFVIRETGTLIKTVKRNLKTVVIEIFFEGDSNVACSHRLHLLEYMLLERIESRIEGTSHSRAN